MGYRLAPMWEIYGGPKISFIDLDATYGTNENNKSQFKASRNFVAYTLYTGFAFIKNTPGVGFEIATEVYASNSEATISRDRTWYYGYGVSFGVILGKNTGN